MSIIEISYDLHHHPLLLAVLLFLAILSIVVLLSVLRAATRASVEQEKEAVAMFSINYKGHDILISVYQYTSTDIYNVHQVCFKVCYAVDGKIGTYGSGIYLENLVDEINRCKEMGIKHVESLIKYQQDLQNAPSILSEVKS